MVEKVPAANDNFPGKETLGEGEGGGIDFEPVLQKLGEVLLNADMVSLSERSTFNRILDYNKKLTPQDLLLKADFLASQLKPGDGNRALQLALLALQKHFKDLLSAQ